MKKVDDSNIRLLFTRVNGKRTFGYDMQSDKTEAECKEEGLSYMFSLNTTTLSKWTLFDLKAANFVNQDIKNIRDLEKVDICN
jgi:hypothetical protein